MLHSGRVTLEEIERLAVAAGFGATLHKGEVIVSGEEGPLAVVSLLPSSTNGIQVCVPAVLETGLRDRIVRAFAPKPEEPRREVSIVLSGPTVPTPGPVRFAPAELLNAAPSPRPREGKSAWTAPGVLAVELLQHGELQELVHDPEDVDGLVEVLLREPCGRT
jgi:hypothetical protein